MTLSTILSGDFAILTANAPRHDVTVEGGNEALVRMAEALGFDTILPVEGMYEGVSDGTSFIIAGMTEKVAVKIGSLFGQDAVVTRRGMVRCADGSLDASWTGGWKDGADALAEDFYSVLPSGEAFSLELDW